MQPPIRFIIISVFLATLLAASGIAQYAPNAAQPSKEPRFFCNYVEGTRGAELCERLKSGTFASNQHAERVVDMIVRPMGLRPNFTLVPCPNYNNAAAVTYYGDRYIVYDNDFMERIDIGASTDFASVSIVAHEVGHHLQGHTLREVSLQQRRENEIEADEFSGSAMFRLGATLPQAQAAIRNSPDVVDEENSTHPKKWRRLEAIERGYEDARSQSSKPTASLYSYKISGWIDSIAQGAITRTPVKYEGPDHMPKFPFPGSLYKLHVIVEQFTNGKYCGDKGEMRESPYMSFRIGETSSAAGECRSTFQGGSQVEGKQLAIYLNPRCQCN